MSDKRHKPDRAINGVLANDRYSEQTEAEGPELKEAKLAHTTRAMFTIDEAALQDLPTKHELAVRDALPPPPGYRYTMDGRLVPFIRCSLAITDPVAQGIFCEVLEVTGSMRAACDAVGIRNPKTVLNYKLKDLDFAESMEAAADRHREGLYAHAVRRATVGYQVPIIGGKDKNQIVAWETKTSDTLLALLLKRHFPEFREATKSGTSVNVTNNTQNNTVNFTKEDAKNLTREQREAMRKLMAPPPTVVDPSGMIDVKVESSDNDDNDSEPGEN